MIDFSAVSVRYPASPRPALREVSLHIAEGELCLVVGRTGAGKSTLLRTINGLVPHFSGGTMAGRVTVAGRDTRTHAPRELADVVGVVVQDPTAGFVTDTVEAELAFGMECLGVAPDVMRRRVEDVLDLLGLAELRSRPVASLSGGQRQRVAIGAVLTAGPQVLVLDEPTSALDPAAAEEVLAALQRLVHDLGLTVVMAEHRLERVVQYADQVVVVDSDGAVTEGAPSRMMATAPVAPPVVVLGRLAGWDPLPLSVRDARRAAAGLRQTLGGPPKPSQPGQPGQPGPGPAADQQSAWRLRSATELSNPSRPEILRSEKVTVRYGDVRTGVVALRDVTLPLHAGEVVAIMGRNGSGKTTLLTQLAALRSPTAGRLVGDVRAGLVPQQPGDLLYETTVDAECRSADRDAGAPPETCWTLLAGLVPDVSRAIHPADLSEGQRLALALAVILVSKPPLVLLDEPTRGLDYAGKAWLARVLRRMAEQGHCVVMATHDVELAAECAHRTVVLADGEVVADGPTGEVVLHSPAYAPQVTKILAPQPWVRMSEVVEAMAG